MTDSGVAPILATPHATIGDAVRRKPQDPLITFYDGISGERVELSATTFANWIAKTANLFRDTLSLPVPPAVAMDLPAHWQTIVVAHAAWALGGCVVTDLAAADFASADLLVRDTRVVSSATHERPDEVLVMALQSMGAPGVPPPPHEWDYDREVRLAADRFTGPVVDPDAPAWISEGGRWSHADVVVSANARVSTGDRPLVRVGRADGSALLDLGVVAAAGRGVVLAVDCDDDTVRRVARQEQCNKIWAVRRVSEQ
jgi:uncharacterized protein (TIGR03089 family)